MSSVRQRTGHVRGKPHSPTTAIILLNQLFFVNNGGVQTHSSLGQKEPGEGFSYFGIIVFRYNFLNLLTLHNSNTHTQKLNQQEVFVV